MGMAVAECSLQTVNLKKARSGDGLCSHSLRGLGRHMLLSSSHPRLSAKRLFNLK
jgi:hypothetical protein